MAETERAWWRDAVIYQLYVRSFAAGNWHHFGEVFEPNAASNTNGIAGGGTRLLVSAGANGMVFFRDPGDADWTRSWLDNTGLAPGPPAPSRARTRRGRVSFPVS